MHHVGLVVAYTWNREQQMFVALGKEFDMRTTKVINIETSFLCIFSDVDLF